MGRGLNRHAARPGKLPTRRRRLGDCRGPGRRISLPPPKDSIVRLPGMKPALILAALVGLSATIGCHSDASAQRETSTASTSSDAVPGGWSKASTTDEHVRKAAQVAVDVAARSSGKPITLVSIDSAEQQVVAGMNYSLKLTVRVAGKNRSADATVWWQAWRPVPYELTAWSLR